MITAKEARELSVPAKERAAELEPLIRDAAARARTSITVRGWWAENAHAGSEEWVSAKRYLESLGYRVEAQAEERQFVDVQVIVRWGA